MASSLTRQPRPYPLLFSPIEIGTHALKNRIVALPVHTGFARPDGSASPWMQTFYTRLAASGAAMVVVANAAVSRDGVVSTFNLRADQDRFLPGLSTLAAAIKARGAVACLQLNHAGRFAKTPHPLLPSAIMADNLAFNVESLKEFMEFFPFEKRFGLTRYLATKIRTWTTPMTDQDRERVIHDFASAAIRAQKAGFDMVELHGANGYLLCQYLSKFTNKLTQGFGGNLNARAAFPLAVIREIKARAPDLPIGFRLILNEWVPQGIDPDQATAFAIQLEQEDIAYLSPSAATYNSLFTKKFRTRSAAPAYLEPETARLKKAVATPVIISGRIISPALAERLITGQKTDLIGLGRPLRADPQWPIKAARQGKKIIPCRNCNHCLKQVVLEKGLNCLQWPKWVQEQTRLEHKLLTRPTRSLWVIADPGDLAVLKPHLAMALSRAKQQTSHALLFLSRPQDELRFHRLKQELSTWLTTFPGAMDNVYSISAAQSLWEEHLIHEIRQKNHGRIFMAARQDQPWRERMLYRFKGKMTGLIGTHPNPLRVMVAVDLSETTLLVIRILSESLMRYPGFSFDFIHVDTGPSKTEQPHTWTEIKQITGMDKDLKLERITGKTKVAGTLAAIIRKRNFGTIVMGKRGLSGIKRLLLGSVSAGLLRQLENQSLYLID